MASTDENPGLLARFYGSRQESSTRRKSAERPFPHSAREREVRDGRVGIRVEFNQ